MAYVTTNPPVCVSAPLTGPGRFWSYRSTDPKTDVDAVDYFSDGVSHGMQVGDVVMVEDTDTSNTMSIHRVITLSAAGATVSAGLTIT